MLVWKPPHPIQSLVECLDSQVDVDHHVNGEGRQIELDIRFVEQSPKNWPMRTCAPWSGYCSLQQSQHRSIHITVVYDLPDILLSYDNSDRNGNPHPLSPNPFISSFENNVYLTSCPQIIRIGMKRANEVKLDYSFPLMSFLINIFPSRFILHPVNACTDGLFFRILITQIRMT